MRTIAKNRTAKLAVKFNNVGVDYDCPLCGGSTMADCGPELFLADSWEVVCRECGLIHEPQLVAMLDLYQNLPVVTTTRQARMQTGAAIKRSLARLEDDTIVVMSPFEEEKYGPSWGRERSHQVSEEEVLDLPPL